MTDDRSQRLRKLIDRVLELPPASRPLFIAKKCRQEPELERRLLAMVAALEDPPESAGPPGPSLEVLEAAPGSALASARPTEPASDSFDESLMQEGPGTRIGPYELLEAIGEGGFGTVFLAEQKEPVARQVALKIIKLGMDTRQVVARFEQERQALALMDHPNIARVLDAGSTRAGRPYFVMDLVNGSPIVEFCDRNILTIDERLALFAQVCNAVQHAHGKGIIHRDLKPSNVLVAEQDGVPQVKVIDFGIAKATNSKLTDKTILTEHEQVIGTLQYMSPEQAAGSLDIDTRTDVYSLGVLLYELLTGSPPLDRGTLGDAIFGEVRRMIAEVDPPKPSTRLASSADVLASVAAQRRVEPRRLGLLLRGELDWIVMKALEKERGRRYESASGLGLDIQRYLGGEAVVAAPPSRIYRAQKFVVRHKGLVAAVVAVAASLLLGAIGFAWQAHIAQDQRDVAILAQQNEAEQRQRAEAITDFVTDALVSSDPNEGGSQGILVTQAMAQANQLLDDGAFEDEPEFEARLRTVIARIFYRNGKVEEALPLARRALTLHERLTDGDDLDLAFALDLVATIEQLLGHLDAAEPLFERALEMTRRLHPLGDINVASALNNLAVLRIAQERDAEAEPLLAESLEIRRRLEPGDHQGVAMAINNLAHAMSRLGRDGETVVAMYEEALAMYERLFTSDPQLAMALNNLANVRIQQGLEAEAEQMIQRSLSIYQELFQGDHPDVARALSSLANISKIRGRTEEAEALFREALAMCQRLFPGGSPQVVTLLGELAQYLQATARVAEAEPLLRQALEMTRQLHPGDHPDVADALDELANVLRLLDRPEEALELMTESLAILERFVGGDDARIALSMGKLARLLRDLGRLTEVEPLCRRALEMSKRLHGGDHVDLASSMGYLALVLEALERWKEAEVLWLEAAAMFGRVQGEGHSNVAQSWLRVAACRDAVADAEGTQVAFAQGIRLLRDLQPDGSISLARALYKSASSRRARGELRDALPEFEEAATMLGALVSPDNERLQQYRVTLSECRAEAEK